MNLRRQLSALMLLLPVVAFAVPYAPAPGAGDGFVEGRDYTVLKTPVPVATPADKLEVREFFYYGCNHCYALEPSVDAWLRTKQADTVFIRTPAVLNPRWELMGRAFYVAEELKMLEKLHTTIYTTIHVSGQKLESKEKVIELFVRMGADKAKTEAAWDSFGVTTKVRSADALARKYMVQGTPTLTVAGKYVVPAGQRAFATIDYLLGVERAARKK